MIEKPFDEVSENDIYERSGQVTSDDPVVAFLYVLMRDHLPTSIVEQIVRGSKPEETSVFSNGWLASYAKDLAERLRAL